MTLWRLPELMMRALCDVNAFSWLVLSVVLGWIVLPLFHLLMPRLRISWYFSSRVGGLAILGYIVWIICHDFDIANATGAGRGWIEFNRTTLLGILFWIVLLGTILWSVRGREIIARLRKNARLLLVGELLFLLFFSLGGALRLVSHGIVDQEKFMDMAFLKSCIYSTTLPPPDPWLYHLPINYYYGGYLLLSIPARILGTAPEVAYNVALALLWGWIACMVFSVAAEITPRVRWALLSVAATAFSGNLALVTQVARYVRSSPPWKPFVFDYFGPSRVIKDHLAGAAPHATINEFPFFSMFHSDLHPHLMAIPFALLFAAAIMEMLVSWSRSHRLFGHGSRGAAVVRVMFTSWVLGWLAMINGFDFLGWILALAVGLFVARRWGNRRGRSGIQWTRGVVVFAILVGSGVFLFLPFWLNFHPPLHGKPLVWDGIISHIPRAMLDHLREGVAFGWTEFRSNPVEFLMVWGIMLFPVVLLGIVGIIRLRDNRSPEARFIATIGIFLAVAGLTLLLGGITAGALASLLGAASVALFQGPRSPRRAVAGCLLITGLLLLLCCELIFIRDSYGRGLQRMNTVFKFHLIAWVMIGISVPFCLREVLRVLRARNAGRSHGKIHLRTSVTLIAGSTAFLFGAALLYPVLAIRERLVAYDKLHLGDPSYDGLRFLRRDQPGDYTAIQWLRNNATSNQTLLEAAGGPYSRYARIGTFSPVRSVLGWGNHERVWRGKISPQIEQDIRSIYQSASPNEARRLLSKYDIQYIYIGSLERKDFSAKSLGRFDNLFPTVYRDTEHDVVIYRVDALTTGSFGATR